MPVPSRPPRRTVRLWMTILYGGLFLVSGAALLAITYALVRHAVVGRPAASFLPAPGGGTAPSPAVLTGQHVLGLKEVIERQQSDVMRELLLNSGIALAVMAVLSIVLGWTVAGRILRRLRTITATARAISATNLHRRLALDGPDDELKELGDTIDALLGRLEAAFEAQRRFVANASHELRTPLTRQRAIGQLALSDPEAGVESLRRAHERILVAGAQQERLIDALLTLARGHAGIEVRRPFDLAGLARETVEARRGQASGLGVTLRTSIRPAEAAGHRPLAERLAANLVDNALRYNAPGGWVEVRTGPVDGRPALVVVNTGPLVPPDAVAELFQPFRRLTPAARTASERGDGLGLGLSIVQAIAAAHDATVTATARPEGGLRVTVTFPPVTRTS
ncbi:ATP-binding protein [Nonomuraea monospora]|uniref:histidine kinase n=1 Tax=Nonomuraea monospora TaxID=568818 RepID=A0ABN3CRX0_9ACTN